MVTLVIYDIDNDTARKMVAEACLDCGLDRIQYSAFRGDLSHNRRQELRIKVAEIMRSISKAHGNIQFYVICEKDRRLSRELDYPAKEETNEGVGA